MGKLVSDDAQLDQLLNELVADPERFNEVMDSWNDLFSISVNGFEEIMNTPNSEPPPTQLENIAATALSSIAKRDHNNEVRVDIAQLLNRFPHAAMMVESSGRISASNDFAFARLQIDTDDQIDALPFELLEAEPLSAAVSSCLADVGKPQEQDVYLKRAFESETKRAVTFAIVPSQGSEKLPNTALVFLVDPEWRADSAKMLKQAFGLTDAEMAIVGLFIAGHSAREISEQRSRSLTTVRTQLQTILNKVGATNQLDLFRVAMGLSQFVKDIEPITKVASRLKQERFDVLRPAGRSVDVMFFGDPEGTPVVYIHSLFTRTVTPEIEQSIVRNRMKFIVPGKPGYGKTSFQPDDQSMVDCYVDDVRAVVDQMGLDKFSILSMVSGSPFMFALCKAMPERILSASSIGSAVPAPYVRRSNITSRWTLALASATKVSPKMAMLMSKSGMRLIKTIGLRRFLARHNGSSKIDCEIMTRADVVEEVRTGMEWISLQGLQAPLNDMTLCFDDWSHLVDGLKMRVTMLQGHHDPHANLASLQEFANAYPDIIDLHDFPDGGQSLMFTHTQDVLDTIKRAPEKLQ